jgi:hypothetical protein
VISTPDGMQKTEIKIDGPAGLPVPSPDGKSVAYVTYDPRPMINRPDLQFWGGTTILVVPTSAGSRPRPITLKNPDEVYDLKWLNNGALVPQSNCQLLVSSDLGQVAEAKSQRPTTWTGSAFTRHNSIFQAQVGSDRGAKIIECFGSLVSTGCEPHLRMNDKYDVKGRVHKFEQRKVWNIGLEHLTNPDSFDVEFSPSGQVLRKTTYNMAGAVMGSVHFHYNDSGKTSRSLEFDGTGKQIHSNDFVHQTDGNRVITASETDGKFAGRTTDVYEGNLLLSFRSYDADNLLKREKTFQYAGSKLQTSDSRYYLPDGTLVEQWLSSYDAEGRIAETYGLKANGKPLGDGKYRCEYDSEGRTDRVWTYNDTVPDEPASGIKIYEYETDEAGNWVARREFYQSRGDSSWSMMTTSRKFTYYPADVVLLD